MNEQTKNKIKEIALMRIKEIFFSDHQTTKNHESSVDIERKLMTVHRNQVQDKYLNIRTGSVRVIVAATNDFFLRFRI